MRTLSYVGALREAHAQLLSQDSRVFIIGQGLWSPWYAGGSMQDLEKEFGRDRVIDSRFPKMQLRAWRLVRRWQECVP